MAALTNDRGKEGVVMEQPGCGREVLLISSAQLQGQRRSQDL
jgi:hypothetical protein